VAEGSRPNELKETRVAKTLTDPKGPVLELKNPGPFPTGTPVIDSQGRLVGLVTTPHAFGEGVTIALGPQRIAQARAAGAISAPAEAASPAASSIAEGAAPSVPAARAAGPVLVAEGFTTLWKEDTALRMVEVMDNPKKGQVGLPLAHWTQWTGRDPRHWYDLHCVVTFGDDDEVVVDYPEATHQFPADGYWMCALTRFGTELDELEEGTYHFMLFADGDKVAENSIQVEKKFFTRGTWAVIVLVLGLGLLAFLRRNKVASYKDQ
jgi:hypothetical protein